MNIKKIADKIIKEGDINPREYTIEDRIDDINTEYLALIEHATQIGSKFPMTDGTTDSEIFTLVAGDNTFTRTIKDTEIVKVEFRIDTESRWDCLDHDDKKCLNCYSLMDMRFSANEKQVFIKDARDGFARITYNRPAITLFTLADYSLPIPPSPDWIPETFHPLLWLRPTLNQAGYYKKDRYEVLKAQYADLFELFTDHYERNAGVNMEFEEGKNNNR
jgi:hypothetical protein